LIDELKKTLRQEAIGWQVLPSLLFI
jgi:hypothetical protein